VGGPYYAYIRLPKLYEAAQNLRGCLGSGPLSRREQQIANLVIARHWKARYPWFAQVRASLAAGIEQPVIDAINARQVLNLPDARERTCFVVPGEILANKGLSDTNYAAAEAAMGPILWRWWRDRQLLDDLHDGQHAQVAPPANRPTALAG
jgi:hypothetical protein